MDNNPRKPIGDAPMNVKDVNLFFAGFILTLVMQVKHPWDLENTFVPIIVAFAVLTYSLATKGKGIYNMYYLKRGGTYLGIAIFFFILGLDDENDYLRIYHGLWHTFGSIASFYLWQSVERNQKKYHFAQTWIDTFNFSWLKKSAVKIDKQ
jgi:hypothetical protein